MGIGHINVSGGGSRIYQRGPAWDEMAVRNQSLAGLADMVKGILADYGQKQQVQAERGLLVDLTAAKTPDEVRTALAQDRSPQSWFGRVAQSQVPGGGAPSKLSQSVLGELLGQVLQDPAKAQLLEQQLRSTTSKANQAEFDEGRMGTVAAQEDQAAADLSRVRNATAAAKGGTSAERARLKKIATSIERQIESLEFVEGKEEDVRILRRQLAEVNNAMNAIDGGIVKDKNGNLIIDTPEKLRMVTGANLDAGTKLAISDGLLGKSATSEANSPAATSEKSPKESLPKATGKAAPAPRPKSPGGSPLASIEEESRRIKTGQAKKAREDAAGGVPEMGTSGRIRNRPMPHPLIGYPQYPNRRPSSYNRRQAWQ